MGRWATSAASRDATEAWRTDHPYVSAIAVVRREVHAAAWAGVWFDENRARYGDDTESLVAAFAEASKDAPSGDELYLEVFETLSPTAVPLPRSVFAGPRDRRWVPTADRTALVPLLVAPPVAEGAVEPLGSD